MHHFILSTIAALSVVIMTFAASFRVRFEANDIFILYLPAAALLFSTVVANALFPSLFAQRLKVALLFALIVGSGVYTFFLGDLQQVEILKRLILNCTLGFFIVLFPWSNKSLELLLILMLSFGCVLAFNTLAIYETLGSRSGYDEEIKQGYLNITLATAFGCIAAMHRIIERIDPVSVAAFVLCWLGIAVSLGRGSLIFCAFITLVYGFLAFSMKIPSMGRFKKMLLLTMIGSLAPVIFYQMMSIERTARRMIGLFSDEESNAGIQTRIEVYEVAWNNILNQPIFGNGLGAYLGDTVSTIGYPHNIVLQYAVDGGAISLGLLTVFLISISYCLYKAIRRGAPSARNTTLACGALFYLAVFSYMKSHDAYRGLEIFIMSALGLSAYTASLLELRTRRRGKRRIRKKINTKKLLYS